MTDQSLRGSFATNNNARDGTPMRAARRLASRARSLCAAGLLLAGCGSASTAGPTTTEATWHGATVEGSHREQALEVLDAAWPRAAERFPGRDLAGWRIVWTDTSISLSAYPTALCGTATCAPGSDALGLTQRQARVIQLSWVTPPSRRVSVTAWELCNALSDSGDRGCS